MKNRLWVGVLGFLLASGYQGFCQEAEGDDEVSATADVGVLSAYVWRGQVLNDETVVQPAVGVVSGDFAVNIWGNMNATDFGASTNSPTVEEGDFNEIDLTLAYGKTLGDFTVGAGFIEYLFPNTTLENTREVYVEASYDKLPVVPSVSLYYDIGEVEGFYANVGLSHEREIGALALGVSGSVGYGSSDYNEFYFGSSDAALNDANVGMTLSGSPVEGLTITPGVSYTWLLDDDVEAGAESLYADKEQWVGSIAASYEF